MIAAIELVISVLSFRGRSERRTHSYRRGVRSWTFPNDGKADAECGLNGIHHTARVSPPDLADVPRVRRRRAVSRALSVVKSVQDTDEWVSVR